MADRLGKGRPFGMLNVPDDFNREGLTVGQIAECLSRLDPVILEGLGYLPVSASGGAARRKVR